mmetsp:Transcript_111376/g.265736  ORF Transcript_111376/g.265736 Transcript_111376/m.265736 type:complete len:396 (+) Transcript_111376:621-1808(+)
MVQLVGTSCSMESILVGFAEVAIVRIARPSTAPHTRLAFHLQPSDLRVRATIEACKASVSVLDRVASILHSSQAAHIAKSAGGCLAIGNVHGCHCLSGSKSQALPVGQIVVGGAKSSRVIVGAGPSTAPHASLTLNLQATVVHFGATIFGAQACQLVLDGSAATFINVQALDCILTRTRQSHGKIQIDLRLLDRWRLALADGHALFLKHCRAAHLRPKVTAVEVALEGFLASKPTLRLAELFACAVRFGCLLCHLSLAEAALLANALPNRVRNAAVHCLLNAFSCHRARDRMLHRLARLAGCREIQVGCVTDFVGMPFSIERKFVGLAKIGIVAVAWHSSTPHAWLTFHLQASNMGVGASIQAREAGCFVLDGIAAVCLLCQAVDVAEHALRCLA